MSTSETSDLWWKNAVVYCLDVETYRDWTGDGTGDVRGLTERIDYLAGMGISCLWLMPFYPSPNRDDGYDIVDYYGVDPRLGSLGEFVELIRTAKDRGLRIIVDLVVNHTSDQHPWFQAARQDRSSVFRDFYVWRDEPPEGPQGKVVFPDAEDSIWSYDEEAGQWYLHHFYRHQPDLNYTNPKVRDEIAKVAGFWLQLGVDGFRVDAVPYLFERAAPQGDLDPQQMLKQLRSFISRRRGDALLLGEVNLPPEEVVSYFGDDDSDALQMMFAFTVNQVLYLALARQDARPLGELLASLPDIPDACQWAMFVRNHDELTLDQLEESERQEVFAAFGPDPGMQLFGRGLRRRLPPMLHGDPAHIRLVYSLLFSLPGAPVLFYGEEIGMGENLDIDGRLSVRTPMQWNSTRSAGFSSAPPTELRRPLVSGEYGPDQVNVADQRRSPDSLLNWMERVIRRRRETPALGFGRFELLDAGDDAVLAHRMRWDGDDVVVLHNLSEEPRSLRVDVPTGRPDAEGPVEVLDLLDDGSSGCSIEHGVLEVELQRYGYRWFRLLEGERQAPA